MKTKPREEATVPTRDLDAREKTGSVNAETFVPWRLIRWQYPAQMKAVNEIHGDGAGEGNGNDSIRVLSPPSSVALTRARKAGGIEIRMDRQINNTSLLYTLDLSVYSGGGADGKEDEDEPAPLASRRLRLHRPRRMRAETNESVNTAAEEAEDEEGVVALLRVLLRGGLMAVFRNLTFHIHSTLPPSSTRAFLVTVKFTPVSRRLFSASNPSPELFMGYASGYIYPLPPTPSPLAHSMPLGYGRGGDGIQRVKWNAMLRYEYGQFIDKSVPKSNLSITPVVTYPTATSAETVGDEGMDRLYSPFVLIRLADWLFRLSYQHYIGGRVDAMEDYRNLRRAIRPYIRPLLDEAMVDLHAVSWLPFSEDSAMLSAVGLIGDGLSFADIQNSVSGMQTLASLRSLLGEDQPTLISIGDLPYAYPLPAAFTCPSAPVGSTLERLFLQRSFPRTSASNNEGYDLSALAAEVLVSDRRMK